MAEVEIATSYVDKSAWGAGPWQDEPDRVEWRSHGFPCLVVRSEVMGALCGYVGVPPGHPLHGIHYGELETELEVHGGLTFSANCDEDGKICHVPQVGEAEDVW